MIRPVFFFRSKPHHMTVLAFSALAVASTALLSGPAQAERISNPTAVFSGLDKISGNISSFEVPVGQTVKFGALNVTPKACYSRSASDDPKTTAFIEVDELTLSKKLQRIFTGWMFASSPGLNGVEHPVYDVWLTDCKGGKSSEPVTPPPTASAKPAKPPRGNARVNQPAIDPPPADPADDSDIYDMPVDPGMPLD